MQDTLLSIRKMTVDYETPSGYFRAVSGVDLDIYANEVFGVVGESGSGKSTMCMGLLRLLPSSSRVFADQIRFDNRNLQTMDNRKFRRIRWEKISYIPQSAMNTLNPVIRIWDHFAETIVDHEGRKSKAELKQRIGEALERVNLDRQVADRYAHELSGGMKQRVCIAMATLLQPQLIIADEPTSALDVISQRTVLQILSAVREKMEASMIMIGHDMALQAQVADRLGIMFGGYFVEVGSVKDIFKNPIHPYTKGLIHSIPSIRNKQDIHALASFELTSEERARFQEPRPLQEVAPGHLVADFT